MNEDDGEFDYPSYFIGCTCPHDPDEHTWGECAVEECDCHGGWE